MKNLVIIGSGPRGLAVALKACLYKDKFNIYVVDKEPTSTWKFPNMLSNMEMRSPITFDLTTFQEQLKEYSLAKFLNKEVKDNTQIEVENNTNFCKREEFIEYLKYIISILVKEGVKFIKREVKIIDNNFISTEIENIYYDYLVIATGKVSQEEKCPSFLKEKSLISTNDLFDIDWKDKIISVIGSGQQSAEVVEYLCSQKASVFWVQKEKPIVNQYPVPSYKEWGIASALGPYYSKTSLNRFEYLMKVKQWGPSITPYINNLLITHKYTNIINPSSTSDLHISDYFLLATGFTQDINLLNINFNIKKNINNNKLPDIVNAFQSSSHPNIYFTGTLAIQFDGPRQGSIISSGITAHTIILSILRTLY